MRLDRDRFVKPNRELVDDLEQLLGPGSVQLCGPGTRRRKKVTAQQPLFKEEEAAADAVPIPPLPAPTAEPDLGPDLEMEAELAEVDAL